MKDLSEAKQELVKSLVKNKKFHQLEFEVNSLLLEKRSPFLLNLLGVSKISKVPTSKKDLNESLDLFKEAYLKDKTFIDALFNYAEISIRLLDYGKVKDFLIEYPMGTDICNRRKDVTDLKFFYPYIDFSEINDDVLPWTTKKETLEELNGRIQDMIQWIKQRDEKTIAIVSHSSFISQYKDNVINDETNELLHCHPYKIEI